MMMKMKKKINVRLTLWLLVIVFLSITLIIFSDTLALFETTATGFTNMDVGKWVIKVNNSTITGDDPEDVVIDSFVYTTSSHTQSGYIAPGGSAYFDMIIDATECDEAVLFNVTFNLAESHYAHNISLSVADVNNYGIVRTGANTYSGIISLADITDEELVTIRVTLTWTNNELLNEDDSDIGVVENNKLRVPITFNAVQYTGETLTAWTGYPTCSAGEGIINSTCTICPRNTYSLTIGTGIDNHKICASCPRGTCTQGLGASSTSDCSASYCN